MVIFYRKKLSIFFTNIKKLPTWEIYICYLKFTRNYLMYREGLSFQTAVHLRRNFQSPLSPLCKRLVLQQDTEDFLKKVKKLGNMSQESILVAENGVGSYPSILHNAGLKAFKGTGK